MLVQENASSIMRKQLFSVCVCWFGCVLQLSCIPWVSKFFLFLDVAVCVKISMELPLIQLVDLVLLQNKTNQSGA